MTTTPITDEYSNHKLAAVFHSAQGAQDAARSLVSKLGLGESQVQLVAPGEPVPGRKLEPESRGILRTIVVSHVRLAVVGAIAGLLVFAVLYALGVPFIVQSPIASALVLLAFSTFGGMMLAVHGTATLIVILWYLHTEFNLHWRRFVSSPMPQNQ